MHYDKGLMWFRRDLRLDDNAALAQALIRCRQVYVVFVFDTTILTHLPRADRRVEFILAAVHALNDRLAEACGQPQGHPTLLVRHGDPSMQIPQLAAELGVHAVFANHDDEPTAQARDTAVRTALNQAKRELHTCKDHVIFERSEVLTQAGSSFSVFTPYKNAWLRRLRPENLAPHDTQSHRNRLAPPPAEMIHPLPDLQALGFEATNLPQLRLGEGEAGAQHLWADFQGRIARYDRQRDFPAIKGPSYLSTHLRFGTLSIRQVAAAAHAWAQQGDSGAATWLSELIWRDFYAQILAHHPHVCTQAFKPAYDRIAWEEGPAADALFKAWCEGRTGYPLVDAAMRQLNQTGYMHNRLRMVTASFLCKDLGLDWRRGEAYFAQHLNDFDLASNNGGWQWASSSGCDAQPYFRIFNPVSQSEKFDADGRFIKRYLPELAQLPAKALHAPWTLRPVDRAALDLGDADYPAPIVDHEAARQRTLARYAVVKTAS